MLNLEFLLLKAIQGSGAAQLGALDQCAPIRVFLKASWAHQGQGTTDFWAQNVQVSTLTDFIHQKMCLAMTGSGAWRRYMQKNPDFGLPWVGEKNSFGMCS